MQAEVSITDRAIKKIDEILAQGTAGMGMRVRVAGGGSSGPVFKLELDREEAGDWVLKKERAKVIVDPKSLVYLSGFEIDYREELTGSGFVFRRSESQEICGCVPLTATFPEEDLPNIW